jgi:hypothetical protein
MSPLVGKLHYSARLDKCASLHKAALNHEQMTRSSTQVTLGWLILISLRQCSSCRPRWWPGCTALIPFMPKSMSVEKCRAKREPLSATGNAWPLYLSPIPNTPAFAGQCAVLRMDSPNRPRNTHHDKSCLPSHRHGNRGPVYEPLRRVRVS